MTTNNQENKKIPIAGVRVSLLHWIDETTRLVELLEVLWRSVSYSNDKDTHTCKGDQRLVEHIRDSLDVLCSEIEDISEGLGD